MTARTPFKIGDSVRLKTGGPAMTIQGLHGVGHCWATCVWFDESKLHKEEFRVEGLERWTHPAVQ